MGDEEVRYDSVVDIISALRKEAEDLRTLVNDKIENILAKVNELSDNRIRQKQKRKNTLPIKYIHTEEPEEATTQNNSTIEKTPSASHNGDELSIDESTTPKRIKNGSDESSGELRSYACEHCEKSYGWQMSLQRHIKECHEGSVKYECKNCLKTFTRNYLLLKHENSCANKQ